MDSAETTSKGIQMFLEPKFLGIPILIWLIIIIVVFYFIYKRKPKIKEFKRMSLIKEMKNDFKELFDIANEKSDKLLYIGATKIGCILQIIKYNWRDIKKNPIKELKEKALETEDSKTNSKLFYGFRVCKTGLIKQVLARFLSIGIKIYLVDSSLVSINPFDININPLSQPINFLDIVIFSKPTQDLVEDVAFKISRTIELEEIINFLPKQTYLEVNQSKTMEELKELSEMKRKQRKEMIEELTKD